MAATQRGRQARAVRQAAGHAFLARQEMGRRKATFLSIAPDIEKIVLFGSPVREQGSRKGSDIDPAVPCCPENFLPLAAEVLRSPFPVDRIDLSTADSRICTAVEREVEVIDEK